MASSRAPAVCSARSADALRQFDLERVVRKRPSVPNDFAMADLRPSLSSSERPAKAKLSRTEPPRLVRHAAHRQPHRTDLPAIRRNGGRCDTAANS